MQALFPAAAFLGLPSLLLSPPAALASPPPADTVHSCAIFDYEQWRRDHPRPAAKGLADLNVGEPRTVRMIYFLPNDRPFRQEVVNSMKTTIRRIRTFYAEQMEAHGYGNTTFRIETDAQGEPLVHHLDGHHPDSHYLDVTGIVYDEIVQVFDLEESIYFVVVDNTIDKIGIGGGQVVAGTGGGYKKSGGALVTASLDFEVAAHELGHAFGLLHDFRDDAYLMSYGEERERLAACAAEFLDVHPYFNSDSSLESDQDRLPTVQLISPPAYPAGTTSVPIQLEVADSQGLHQVILFAVTRDISGTAGASEIKACRGLSGETDRVVEFDYNGAIPSSSAATLSDPVAHPIRVQVVNSEGDVGHTDFVLSEVSPNLVATLEGHTSEVNSVAFSPDGTILASSGSWDNEIKLWDVNARESFATLRGHTGGVSSVAFSSPDGGTLASGSWDSTIKLWDGKTGGPIATLEEHTDGVVSVSFSPGGDTLASGSRDGEVKLWDVRTREVIGTLGGHTGEVTSVSFSPDGALLASAGGWGDPTVQLWDVAAREPIANLEGHLSEVTTVAFSPDGATLASGARDRTVRLWDVETREQIAAPLYGHGREVTSVSFPTPCGSILASASRDGTVILWDLVAREETAAFGHTDEALSVSFAVGGATLAAGWRDGNVLLWDTSQWTGSRPSAVEVVSGDGQQGTPGAALAQPLVVEVRDQYGNPLPGAAVTFTVTAGKGRLSGRFAVQDTTADANGRAELNLTLGPDPGLNTVGVFISGRELAVFTAEGVGTAVVELGGDYQTWHLPPGATVRLGKGALGEGDRAVALSADGRCLAVASAIGVWLYEASTARAQALLPTETPVHSVALSLGGTLAAGLDNGQVELWEVETGERIGTLSHGRQRVTALVFSPDGTALATGSVLQIIKVWDVESRREVGAWDVLQKETDFSISLYPVSVAYSPDGKRLASGFKDGTVRLWDVATQTEVAILEGHTRRVPSVSFSRDGSLLASAGSFDKTVRIWDVATQAEVARLRGHHEKGSVLSVSFSPDGAHLASGGGDWDETVVLWDMATREPITTLGGHAGAIRSVTFSPDGARLVSGSEDGTVLLHDLEMDTAIGITGHGSLSSMAFSADGALLATGYGDGTASLWDAATQRLLFTVKGDVFLGHPPEVSAVSFSPDGLLATAQWYVDHPPTLWDVGTGERIGILRGGPTPHLVSVSFSPDGSLLAAGAWNGTVRLWDVASREKIGTLNAHRFEVSSVLFSPDGALLATGSRDGRVRLWDVETRSSIATGRHPKGVYSLAFSPEGRTLVAGGWGTVTLWDVEDRTRMATLEGHSERVDAVAFSSDGATLASSGAGDGKLRLWNVATRREIATFDGHTRWVHSLAFRDGTVLASGASDGTMLLWSLGPHPRTLTTVGHRQQGPAGSTLAQPFVVLVLDQYGDPLAGAKVTFSIAAGGGTLSATTVTTDADGHASTTLTLGRQPGPNTVVATIAGLEPVTFTVEAAATPDFDGDGLTGFPDFFLFAEAFGGTDPRFDLDGNGSVDFADFFLFAEAFGQPARAKLVAMARELIGLPDGPQLRQNAPNPFNSGTVISWFQLQPGLARLEVYALTGQRVAVLQEGPRKAGFHRLRWDGRDERGRQLASGVYLYRLVTTEAVQTRKLTLLR